MVACYQDLPVASLCQPEMEAIQVMGRIKECMTTNLTINSYLSMSCQCPVIILALIVSAVIVVSCDNKSSDNVVF